MTVPALVRRTPASEACGSSCERQRKVKERQ